jgi:hypothetical protein
MFETREPSIEALRNAPVKLRYTVNGKTRRILMDALTANAILTVYDAVAGDLKTMLETALKNPAKLNKLVTLCFSWITPRDLHSPSSHTTTDGTWPKSS